ncbi:MAG: hypothetical protein AAF797_07030 [Planctomycetota bacterium]
MPDPIEQIVRTVYDDAGIDAASEDLARLEADVRDSSTAMQQQERAVSEARSALLALVAAEEQHEAAVASGQAVDSQARQTSEQRQQAIAALSSQIARGEDAQSSYRQRVDELVGSHRREQQAVEAVIATRRGYDQRLRGLRDRLQVLSRAEQRHADAVDRGERATEEATRASARRRQQIDRVARVLGQEEQAQRRASDAVRQYSRASDDATGSTRGLGGAFGFAAGQAKTLVGGLVGVGGLLAAYRLIKAELDDIIERQREALGEQVTLASAERSLKLNLVGSSDQEVASAIDASGRIALDSGIDRAAITQALSGAVSATGGDLNRSIQLVELAADIRPDQPDELVSIAGAIGDTQAATNFEDPLAALGFLQQVGAQSRIADSGQQFRNIPQAITGLVAQGFTPQDAGALFAAQSVSAADLRGETTRTAVIQIAEQLSSFFAERERPERGADAITALQGDDELRGAFLDEFSVEAQQLAPARALFASGTEEAQRLQAARSRIAADEEQLRELAVETIDRLGEGARERNAALQRELLAQAQDVVNADFGGGEEAAIREGLERILIANGVGPFQRSLDLFAFDRGAFGSPRESAIGILQSRQRRVLNTFFGGVTDVDDLPEARRVQFDSFQQAIDRLNELPETPPSSEPPPPAPEPVTSLPDAFDAIGDRLPFLPPDAERVLSDAGVTVPDNVNIFLINAPQPMALAPDLGPDDWEASRGVTGFRRLSRNA